MRCRLGLLSFRSANSTPTIKPYPTLPYPTLPNPSVTYRKLPHPLLLHPIYPALPYPSLAFLLPALPQTFAPRHCPALSRRTPLSSPSLSRENSSCWTQGPGLPPCPALPYPALSGAALRPARWDTRSPDHGALPLARRPMASMPHCSPRATTSSGGSSGGSSSGSSRPLRRPGPRGRCIGARYCKSCSADDVDERLGVQATLVVLPLVLLRYR